MVSEIDPKYKYTHDGLNAIKIGQLAAKAAQSGGSQTVEEIINEMAPKYLADLEKCINDNLGRYQYPFYILVMSKKEMWATNLIRNFFIARQTQPHMYDMMIEYPNNVKTLYLVNATGIKLLWSLPDFEACKSIAARPDSHDPQLLEWIEDCFYKKEDIK